jgi:hypothetical protein
LATANITDELTKNTISYFITERWNFSQYFPHLDSERRIIAERFGCHHPG